MTANVEALLPGVEVLFDTDEKWASQPLRGRRGVVVRRIDAAIGHDFEFSVCIGPCDRSRHDEHCFSAVAFRADELLLVPEPGVAPPDAAPSRAPGSHLVPDGAAPHDGFGVGLVSS